MNTPNQSSLRVTYHYLVRTVAIGALLVIVLTSSAMVRGSTDDKVMDVGAIMPDNGSNKSSGVVNLVFSNPKPFELNVRLPTLLDHERKKFDAPSMPGPQKIGIHREIPFIHLGDLSGKLNWKKDGDGVVAYVRVRSPDATSIRFSGQLKLPADANISFYETNLSGKNRVIDSFTTTKKGFDEETLLVSTCDRR